MGFMGNAFGVLIASVALVTIPSLFVRGPPKYRGAGFAAPGWEKVIEVFRDNVDKGLEKGGAFAVYYKGELVVDYAGGYADVEAEWQWDVNTLTQIYSSTKGVMAVVMAMLVDRGLIKYDDPVAKYWPEFAQNGKEKITIEQILSHQAGLAVIDEKFSGLGDPDVRSKILAKQKPAWTPGEKHGYHALTIGLYADEILKRVDPKHRDMSQFFEEEISQKYGIDLHMGLRDSEVHRTARVYGEDFSLLDLPIKLFRTSALFNMFVALALKPDSDTSRAMTNPVEFKLGNPGSFNHPISRRMTNPSAGGFATARGLANFWSIVANGGQHSGKHVVSEAALQDMAEIQGSGFDQVLLLNTTYSRGVSPIPAETHDGMTLGTPGAGGQMGYADPKLHLSWAYITNHHVMAMIGEDPRYSTLIRATYQAVNDLEDQNQK